MFEKLSKFFKGLGKKEKNQEVNTSKDTAKERLHLVLMQDRANVSADFLELMKQEIIDVIKKYIEVDEEAIDVRLTNKANDDGTTGAPALYANIPIMNIKHEMGKETEKEENTEKKEEELQTEKKEAKVDEEASVKEKATAKEKEEVTENKEEPNEPEENKETKNEEEQKEEIPVTSSNN